MLLFCEKKNVRSFCLAFQPFEFFALIVSRIGSSPDRQTQRGNANCTRSNATTPRGASEDGQRHQSENSATRCSNRGWNVGWLLQHSAYCTFVTCVLGRLSVCTCCALQFRLDMLSFEFGVGDIRCLVSMKDDIPNFPSSYFDWDPFEFSWLEFTEFPNFGSVQSAPFGSERPPTRVTSVNNLESGNGIGICEVGICWVVRSCTVPVLLRFRLSIFRKNIVSMSISHCL